MEEWSLKDRDQGLGAWTTVGSPHTQSPGTLLRASWPTPLATLQVWTERTSCRHNSLLKNNFPHKDIFKVMEQKITLSSSCKTSHDRRGRAQGSDCLLRAHDCHVSVPFQHAPRTELSPPQSTEFSRKACFKMKGVGDHGKVRNCHGCKILNNSRASN